MAVGLKRGLMRTMWRVFGDGAKALVRGGVFLTYRIS